MYHQFSFPKSEHLCLKSTFDELFDSGKTIYCNGIKVVWFAKNNEIPVFEIAVTVSKRNFKKAVDRNTLKRRMREAFRLHKTSFVQLLDELKLSVSFIFIYTRKELKEYREIEENVIHSLSKLEHELGKWKQNNTCDSLAIENGSDIVD